MGWYYLVALTVILLVSFSCAPKTSDYTPSPSTAPDSIPTTEPGSTPVPSPSESVPRITVEELFQKIEDRADIIIVDTRADVEEQFPTGHIKGAVPVPLSKITAGQWLPPADKEIIFYCT